MTDPVFCYFSLLTYSDTLSALPCSRRCFLWFSATKIKFSQKICLTENMEQKNLRNFLNVILAVLGLNNIWFLFVFYCWVILDIFCIESIQNQSFCSVIVIHKLEIARKKKVLWLQIFSAAIPPNIIRLQSVNIWLSNHKNKNGKLFWDKVYFRTNS